VTHYFVMLRGQKGHPIPLVDADSPEDPHLFSSEAEARAAAMGNMFGENFGFEIISWDMPKDLGN
jgi:hypothetical protein